MLSHRPMISGHQAQYQLGSSLEGRLEWASLSKDSSAERQRNHHHPPSIQVDLGSSWLTTCRPGRRIRAGHSSTDDDGHHQPTFLVRAAVQHPSVSEAPKEVKPRSFQGPKLGVDCRPPTPCRTTYTRCIRLPRPLPSSDDWSASENSAVIQPTSTLTIVTRIGPLHPPLTYRYRDGL
jgi:hypothetical protein